jgi:hypothetical protein
MNITSEQWTKLWLTGQVPLMPLGRNVATTGLAPLVYREPKDDEIHRWWEKK